MRNLIGLVILVGIVKWLEHGTEWKYNRYHSPEGYRVDYNLQALDKSRNNLSNEQIMLNTMAGKYNKRDDVV